MNTRRLLLVLAAAILPAALAIPAETVRLETLDLSKMRQGWGKPQVNRSIREKPLSIAGQTFEHGVGTHARSTLWIDLGGTTEQFLASVGVDDAAGGKASVGFRVIADGKKLFDSGVMKPGDAAKPVEVDLKGVKTLLLEVIDGGDGVAFDHANWADARFMVAGAPPKAMAHAALSEKPYLLTPKPGLAPRINGPKVIGCRPGNPFLFRIPTTGERPMRFYMSGHQTNLPDGIRLETNGILVGTAPKRGEYEVRIMAENRHGSNWRRLKIVSGDTLALTPTMGWNHWYTHYDRITDKLMRDAADVMVSSGMADVGYQYVNIDDCWMNAPKQGDPRRVGPLRDAAGNIIPNKHFPDMKAMTDYIHSKGLKAGIYTSPGPFTCAGFAGAYQHEAQDAKLFADWGFDFLKYDWCFYGGIANKETGPELAKFKKPYTLMGDLLKQQKRDMIFNLCQYGMGDVWKWGAEVGGHSWRTAGDLGFELDRIFEVALKNAEYRDWQKPGAWNDPDYVQIGQIGNARGMGEPIDCPLTPTEQYSFMSLWALSAAPLFFSGDMNRLDDFTINVLCNPEVIDINQDTLGQCGRVIPVGEDLFVMVKELEDGSKAVGLGNKGEFTLPVTAKWSDLGVRGKQIVSDVWRQKNIGTFENEFRSEVPRRGVVLVRMRAAEGK